MTRALPCLLALALAAPAAAHEAEAVRAFGDDLLSSGDAYRAIGAYKEYLFLQPEAADADLVRYRIALSYFVGGQDDAAWRHAARVEGRPEVVGPSRLLAGRALYGLGQYELAAGILADRDEPYARYTLGWSRLQAFELEPAAEAFASMGTDAGTRLAGLLRSRRDLPHRSPMLAGLLSVVPGLGHAYVGQWSVAFSALTWNGVFAWGLVETFRTGQWGLFALLAVVESLWYTGSIYGAVVAAQRFNRDARLSLIDELGALFPPPGPPPQPDLPGAPPLGLHLGIPLP